MVIPELGREPSLGAVCNESKSREPGARLRTPTVRLQCKRELSFKFCARPTVVDANRRSACSETTPRHDHSCQAACRGCKLIVTLVAVLTSVAITLALFVPSLTALLLHWGRPIFLATSSLFALGWPLLFVRSWQCLLLLLCLRLRLCLRV